ncbi:catalase [Xanthomonas vasicola pv. arecae]|uniref:LodA/GoxA family CTQ-dependent oxidase n=1 Tax=Xanthomonas vasicola TaxID=56459 RepID=UPI00052D5298|nr:LodA/GoxA family CTQ-dependent oxidase [Xanthomonas vasicola]AZR26941.1 catalase [Xanthomonas vasicola pv. arecae]KGR55748.1 catalase [Xanthomonas vasicola]KGT83205.1 catalase [Xanthomonas vasicola]
MRSSDLRDIHGALKRHAARFRIFAYPDLAEKRWPRGGGQEIVIGSTVGDNTVIDIVWTVHVAKKKTTTFILPEAGRQRIASYSDGHLPPIRNPSIDKPHAPLTTDRDLSDDYATAVQARFSEYLINRNHFDDLERRWPDSAFWARRQARLDLAGVA